MVVAEYIHKRQCAKLSFNMEMRETYLEVVQNGSKEGMVHNPVQPTRLYDHHQTPSSSLFTRQSYSTELIFISTCPHQILAFRKSRFLGMFS